MKALHHVNRKLIKKHKGADSKDDQPPLVVETAKSFFRILILSHLIVVGPGHSQQKSHILTLDIFNFSDFCLAQETLTIKSAPSPYNS